MRALPIDPLPGMPPLVLGLSIVRGVPVPVIDAGSLLDAANSRAAYFVAVAVGGHPAALAVDEVFGLQRLAEEVLAPLPPLLRNVADDAIAAIRARDGELLLLLETARLLPPHLLAKLTEIGAER
jgi:purine-binding chemotaxis protein CheW